MARNHIHVDAGGFSYSIATDESQDYADRLGKELNQRISSLMTGDDRLSVSMATILIALEELDRACKAEETANHLREQLSGYFEENRKLRAQLEKRNGQ